MLKMAFENLIRKKSRTILAMLALIIGVMTIVSLISITTGVKERVNSVVSQMKGIMVTEEDLFMPILSKLDETDMNKIEGIPGVSVVAPRISGQIFMMEEGEKRGFTQIPTTVMGIEPAREAMTKKGPLPTGGEILRGRALKSGDTHSVLIDEDTADDQKKFVGSKIKIKDKDYDIVGLIEATGGQGRMIVMPLDQARETLDMPTGKVTGFYVEASNPEEDKLIAKKIEAKLDGVDAKTTEEFGDQMMGMLSSVDSFLWIISLISIVVGGLGIINTMLMSVRERTKEFGVLKAIGWTQENIIQLVMYESILIGIGGGVFGTILGWIAVQIAKPLLGIGIMTVTPELALQATLFAVVVGVIGGVYPAWEASRLDPIEAISKE